MSLIAAADTDMQYTLRLEVTESSSATILRNIYECFRMPGQAMLLHEGAEADDHAQPINRPMELRVDTQRPTGLLDTLRTTRHQIK